MNPRGVTLVELLAAISILVVVTALSLPAVQGRLGAARLEAAQGQIDAAVLATRAEAVKVGRPLVLSAFPGRDGGVELLVASLTDGSSPLDKGGEGSGDLARPRGSVWCILPGGVRVTLQPTAGTEPVDHASTRAGGAAEPDPDAFTEDDSVRLAVFCPDGTAVVGAPTYLGDGSVDLAISINAWIGGASFAPYVPPDSDSGEDQAPSGLTGVAR